MILTAQRSLISLLPFGHVSDQLASLSGSQIQFDSQQSFFDVEITVVVTKDVLRLEVIYVGPVLSKLLI